MKSPLVLGLALLAGSSTAYADNVVVDWNMRAAQTIGAGARRGPSGLIDYAVVHASIHDAIQSYEQRLEPYCSTVPGATGSPIAAAAGAAHRALITTFPSQANALNDALAASLAKYSVTGDPGVAVGQAAADCVLQRLAADNVARATPDSFMGGNAPGEWRPTSFHMVTGNPLPMTADFLATMTPFTLKDPAQFRANNGPPKLTSGAYAKDYYEVLTLGAKNSTTRTLEQTRTAQFYSDGPPGYWNRTMQKLTLDRSIGIGDSARMFALVNMAMADAIITSWDSKQAWNFWRPLTAIHLGDHDGNDRTAGDTGWEPFALTPNYPDYTSGANNLAGAAATMLANFFGTDEIEFTLTSVTIAAPHNVRVYSRFSDAGRDVVDARVFMGIHFRFADGVAYRQGTHVANWAFGKFLRPVGVN